MRTPLLALLVFVSCGFSPAQPPAGVETERKRAEEFFAQQKYKESSAAWERCVRLEPGNVDNYHGAAMALVRMRRFNEAAEKLQFATTLAPDDPKIAFDYASTLHNQARWTEAIVQWRRVEALGYASEKVSTTPEIPYNRGKCAMRLELVPEAVEALGRAISLAPDRLDYREQLAGTLLDAGRNAEAAREFETLVARAPSNAKHHFHLGRAYLQMGEDEKAEEQLRAARRLDPRDANASLQLGKLFLRRQQTDHAYSFYLEAGEKNPLSADAWYNLARLAAQRGAPEDAERYQKLHQETQEKQDASRERHRTLVRRINADPNDADAYFELAIWQVEQGAFDFAQENFLRMLVIRPRHELAISNLASILAKDGHLNEARWELDKILESDPGHPWANIETGRVWARLQDLPRAVAHLRRGLERVPADDSRYASLVAFFADVAFQAKLLPKASETMQTALAKVSPEAPEYVLIAVRYGQACLETKRPADAIPALESAAGRTKPDSDQRKAVFQLLARLAQAAGDAEGAQRYLAEAAGGAR